MRLHNRQIKATFWSDPDVCRWPRDKRLFYIGLSQLADDSGCLEDDPYAWKLHLFRAPADTDITEDLLMQWRDELVAAGKLVPYEVRGRSYLFLTNFHKHQSPDRPTGPHKAAIPLPPWVTWQQGETRRTSRYVVDYDLLLEVGRPKAGQWTASGQPVDGQRPANGQPVDRLWPGRTVTVTVTETETETETGTISTPHVPPSPEDGQGPAKKKPPPKKHYAEYVLMTEDEYRKLVEKYGPERTTRMIEVLNNYKGASGKKYKSDYLAILNWVVNRVMEEEQGGTTRRNGSLGRPGRGRGREPDKWQTSILARQRPALDGVVPGEPAGGEDS